MPPRNHWPKILVLLAIALCGCQIKLVADYDQPTFEEVLKAGKKVDQFYGSLLERPQNQRPYAQFSSQYVDIESDLRSLVTRNQARPLNQESTKISGTILELWLKYKAAHQEGNGYTTAIATLHRNRFIRLFNAAASAEEAKKLPADEKDPSKE
jgi:hypothetical protein